jgi:hypothetical protein
VTVAVDTVSLADVMTRHLDLARNRAGADDHHSVERP